MLSCFLFQGIVLFFHWFFSFEGIIFSSAVFSTLTKGRSDEQVSDLRPWGKFHSPCSSHRYRVSHLLLALPDLAWHGPVREDGLGYLFLDRVLAVVAGGVPGCLGDM